MNITQILGISHTCPACHTEFVKLNTLKGLSFCPHCHQHVRFSPKPIKRWSDDWSFTKRLAASAGLAAFTTAFFFFARDIAWLNTWAEIVSHIMIGAFLLLGVLAVAVAIWGRGRLKSDAVVACGVDDFEVVKQERCPTYKLTMPSASGQLKSVVCPACQSMRLADLYWYKTCWGAQEHKIEPISDVDDLKFYGCLHCGKRFETVSSASKMSKSLVAIVALLLFFCAFLPIIMTIYPDLPSVFAPYGAILAFLVLLLYSMLVVFPWQTHDIYADSHLQEITPKSSTSSV
jgi:DNA-directed RNA polymerase subunit RPC12/RpoP